MIASNENGGVSEDTTAGSATSEGAIPTSDPRNLVDDVLDAVGHKALVDRIIARWDAYCRSEAARAERLARFLDALREADGSDMEGVA